MMVSRGRVDELITTGVSSTLDETSAGNESTHFVCRQSWAYCALKSGDESVVQIYSTRRHSRNYSSEPENRPHTHRIVNMIGSDESNCSKEKSSISAFLDSSW